MSAFTGMDISQVRSLSTQLRSKADEIEGMAAGADAYLTKPFDDEEILRRLAAVFGDVLPDTTSDERDPEAPSSGESATDTWLRAQVPPHHG